MENEIREMIITGKKRFVYEYLADELGRYKRLVFADKEILKAKIEEERLSRENLKNELDRETPLSDMIVYWIENIASATKTQSLGAVATKTYIYINNRMIKQEIGDIPVCDLKTETVVSFLNNQSQHTDEKLKEVCEMLNCFFAFTNKLGFTNIKTLTPPKSTLKEKTVLSLDDLHCLYSECLSKKSNGELNYSNSALVIAFICATGVTLRDAIYLKWDDIDFENETITYTQRNPMVTLKYSPQVRQVLNETKKTCEYVFATKNNKIMNKCAVENFCRVASNYTCIPKATPNAIRYSFGRLSILEGYSAKEIMRAMDYSSVHFFTWFDSVINELPAERQMAFRQNKDTDISSGEYIDLFKITDYDLITMSEEDKINLIIELRKENELFKERISKYLELLNIQEQ